MCLFVFIQRVSTFNPGRSLLPFPQRPQPCTPTELPNISGYLSQYLTNLMHKICFILSFISCLYMFRAHVLIIRGVKIALHSLWYHHTYRWPSRARGFCCIKLVKYWDKYTEMHGQQTVKISGYVFQLQELLNLLWRRFMPMVMSFN